MSLEGKSSRVGLRALTRAALALSCLRLSSGCVSSTVTRVVDGEQLEGRPVAAEAYAAYTKAELLAARGDRKGALAELERALEADPESPELVTRYGDVLCEEQLAPAALDRYERALELDPDFAPAFLGRARCLSRLGDSSNALIAARKAADLDPLSLDTTREVARLLFALRRPREAWLWLEARVLYEPGSRGALSLLLEAAERQQDVVRSAEARRLLDAAAPPERDAPASAAVPLRALPASPALALAQAERRLAADPEDTDAWAAGLVAADLLGDEAHFATVLGTLGENPLPASPRALVLLQGLLARRCGTEAAAAIASSSSEPAAR